MTHEREGGVIRWRGGREEGKIRPKKDEEGEREENETESKKKGEKDGRRSSSIMCQFAARGRKRSQEEKTLAEGVVGES